jgi:hypothetical protein
MGNVRSFASSDSPSEIDTEVEIETDGGTVDRGGT